jgi:molybdopterin synthase sulfur carrier subunit
MKLQLKYFASVRETIGLAHEAYETQASTVAALRAELCTRSTLYAQGLAPERSLRMAVNQRMVDEITPLHEGAEVAFFPPVTGG